MVSQAGIATLSSVTCAPFALMFRGRLRTSNLGGGRDVPLYFGVGLELLRNAVTVSPEQTYLGHFGAWVDFRVRCVECRVFSSTVGMTWPTFGAYLSRWRARLPPRKCGRLPSRVICLRSNTFTLFRAVSSSTLPTSSSLATSKALLVRTPTRET